MNCTEAQYLLHAYIDAELDVANGLEVEQHLQKCPDCQRDYHDCQALRTAIRSDALYFQTPELLQKRVQSSLRKKEQLPTLSRVVPWKWLSVAAALLFAAFGIWGLMQLGSTPSGQNNMAQQVLDSHVRSLMASHLIDVPFSNQHNIKPWFEGKLDFSPPVIDLTTQGFTLIGGRLDYLDNQPVAAIVYKCGNHVINFFVWPATRRNGPEPISTTLQGYNLIYWKAYGMNCWAVSDLNLSEMQQFAQLIEQRTDVAAVSFGLGP